MENNGQSYDLQPATQYGQTEEPTAPMYQQSVPAYGPQHVMVQQPPQPPQQTVVIVGGCPVCRVGLLQEDFTPCGILCCILFFPLGILCCYAMREKLCTNCGASFNQ